MKEGIHPQYYPEATVVCSCGNSWTVGSTIPSIRTDVCSACHPFFTGEQRIVDSEGQVDRFYQRLEKRQQIQETIDSMQKAAALGSIPLEEMDLKGRTLSLLKEQGINTISELLAELEKGEDNLLRISGFGQKSLIEVRKWLRAEGYIE
ncbi:MAG: 50S ribosomal protein L31 [Anaerolineales bacterium]|nr:50S ribosomal protein L31 [Anaerolineales bacterium]